MGSKSTKTTQENKPPAWAVPGLKLGAKEAMRLYQEGKGYNTYTGPTQAPLSAQTLGGMNALMAATGGGGGAPITMDSIRALIPQVEMPQQAVPPIPQQSQGGNPLDWRFGGASSDDLKSRLGGLW